MYMYTRWNMLLSTTRSIQLHVAIGIYPAHVHAQFNSDPRVKRTAILLFLKCEIQVVVNHMLNSTVDQSVKHINYYPVHAQFN